MLQQVSHVVWGVQDHPEGLGQRRLVLQGHLPSRLVLHCRRRLSGDPEPVKLRFHHTFP